ncbi:MAG: hypothetical protein ABIG44_15155 [Planctomycetota bacterium]
MDETNRAGPTIPRYRIAVIPKGTTHVFWKSFEAGTKQAGAGSDWCGEDQYAACQLSG